MKKLFIVLAVASLGFASCSNDSTSEEQKRIDDSIAAKHTQDSLDALKPATPAMPDSLPKPDSMPKMDSPAKKK